MTEIFISNSDTHRTLYHEKSVEEIYKSLNGSSIDYNYFRNAIGQFWGNFKIIKNQTYCTFQLSDKLINSPNFLTNLDKHRGFSYSWPVVSRQVSSEETINTGFLIVDDNETIKSIRTSPLIIECPIISNKLIEKLLDKNVLESVNEEIIKEFYFDGDNFIFWDEEESLSFIIINQQKVFLSSSVASLSQEQFKMHFDDMIFYSGIQYGKRWFRLGLPHVSNIVEITR